MTNDKSRRRVSMTAGVKVRDQPSPAGAILGVLPKDAVVDVIGQSGDWLAIRFQEQEGYVAARFTVPTSDHQGQNTAVTESHARAGHVFISYERSSRDYVDSLCGYLDGHGVSSWFDHKIDYGANWATVIQQQLDASDCMIVVMTRAAGESKWVGLEIQRAQERGIPIFPLLTEQNGVIESLRHLQFSNVIDGSMPPLALCQQLPGFLVNERDVMNALSERQLQVAKKIAKSIGVIRRGDKGTGVAALQIELTRIGLDPGPIDGEYGEKTFRALREFQQRRYPKATIDGMLGPITVAVLINSSLGDLA